MTSNLLPRNPLDQCVATTNDGKRCKKLAKFAGTLCFSHTQDEEIKAKRHEVARIAGTKNERMPKMHKIDIRDSRDLHRYLANVLTNMARGRIKTTTSNLKDISSLSKVFMETEGKAIILERIERIEKNKQS